jgi:hypothetical protein
MTYSVSVVRRLGLACSFAALFVGGCATGSGGTSGASGETEADEPPKNLEKAAMDSFDDVVGTRDISPTEVQLVNNPPSPNVQPVAEISCAVQEVLYSSSARYQLMSKCRDYLRAQALDEDASLVVLTTTKIQCSGNCVYMFGTAYRRTDQGQN